MQRSGVPIISVPLMTQSSMKTHSKLHTIGVLVMITHMHIIYVGAPRVSQQELRDRLVDGKSPSPDQACISARYICQLLAHTEGSACRYPGGRVLTSTSITFRAGPWRGRTVPKDPLYPATIKSQSICGVAYSWIKSQRAIHSSSSCYPLGYGIGLEKAS